ncbi:unnamed protein product [Closterium sp. Naga37s-1]|nr:unnamed protein product [Closterium sp. Naga37s-1]
MAHRVACCSGLATTTPAGAILPRATSARTLDLRRSLLFATFPSAIAPHISASFPARRASATPRASQSSADAATRTTGAHAPSSATNSPESAEASAREAAALEAATARVITLSSREEYDRLMAEAKNKGRLAVVEVTMSTLPNTDRIYHTLVETARLFPNAVFLRIFADKGAELRGLAQSMHCARVPSYVLFREGQRVHEDAGMDAERLRAELLYYSAEGPVLEVHSAEEFRALIEGSRRTFPRSCCTSAAPVLDVHSAEEFRALIELNLSHLTLSLNPTDPQGHGHAVGHPSNGHLLRPVCAHPPPYPLPAISPPCHIPSPPYPLPAIPPPAIPPPCHTPSLPYPLAAIPVPTDAQGHGHASGAT